MSAIHVELLTEARKRINTGSATFICIAIPSTAHVHEAFQLRDHIKQLLDGEYTLEGWIRQKCGLTEEPCCKTKKMRDTRLAWIDWLIEEWRDAP